MNQEEYKRKLIQLIQVNKNKVFADDEQRREFMFSRFGVDSTKRLTIDELKLLLDFCKGKISDIAPARATERQLYKISKLWTEKARDKSDSALLSFIKRIISKELQTAKELTKAEAINVIVALDKMKG